MGGRNDGVARHCLHPPPLMPPPPPPPSRHHGVHTLPTPARGVRI